jgi:CubicO group peptidase (beta-lactamase class C family)
MLTLCKGVVKMKKITKMVIILLLSVCFSSLYSKTINLRSEIEPQLLKICEEESDFKKFWGAVLVAKGNEIFLEEAFGYTGPDRSTPLKPTHKFRIASITKQFTAASILMLAERKKINLNDKLSDFFEGFPNGEEIEIKNLLNHTSGLETIINSEDLYFEIMKENGVSILEKTLNYIRKKEARFKPEEEFFYSNSGYVLLGAVIEKISGLTYAQFIKENILIPLDMSSSGYDTNEYDSSWAVPCKRISYNPDVVASAPWLNREIPNGAGGLYSTVYDIYKWHKALNENLLISEETRRMMETPSNALMGAGYGVFSVEVFTNGKYHRLVYHDGATAGTSTRISRYTDDDIVVIVLSNLEDYDFAQLSHALAKAVITYLENNGL